MKAILNVILVSLVVMLAGCNDEIGEGKNVGPNTQQQEILREPSTAEDLYGPVMHKGKVAPSELVMVSGQDITNELTFISILTRGTKSKPGTAFMLMCDKRGGEMGMGSNIYTPTGQSTERALDIAIMNFKPGLTEIRETDDMKRAYFSTAEGDRDIIGALKGLAKLDPESTITFVTEETKDDGYRYSTGWSPMFKVKDVVAGLKKVDLSKCKGLSMAEDYYTFMSNETLMQK